jgi:hypothetical protein
MNSKTHGRGNEAIRNSLEKLAEKWPSTVVARSQISKFSGGLVAPGTCANLDSLGVGIPGACRIGRQVAYPVEAVINWLISRAEA